jgi:hypothetical protein
VEAFYTTAIFKLERWLLARLLKLPSTDAEAARLAASALHAFAAWSVESRGAGRFRPEPDRGEFAL